MGTLLNSTILSPVRFPKPSRANPKAVKARAVRCLRKNGDTNGLPKLPSQFEEEDLGHEEKSREIFRPPDFQSDEKSHDVWKLFEEAQQNILYLNKQRLVAIEELKNANKEKELLLDRLEQLEAEKPSLVKKDKRSLFWELLLRIDSMVLSGMISAAEASELRKMVLSNKYSVTDIFLDIVQKSDAELLSELRHFEGRKQNEFHIIHICTEMAPLVVGSVASYVTGLSHALQKKGHVVEVILPKYAFLDLSAIQGLREIEAESYSYFNGQLHGNKIWTGIVHGIGVTLIQPLSYSPLFNRERLYGYSDDFERFAYFSRASLDYIAKSGKRPDVLHIHNWETAIVGPLFWDIFVNQFKSEPIEISFPSKAAGIHMYMEPAFINPRTSVFGILISSMALFLGFKGLGDTRILLTCHGFDSLCLEQPEKLALCGLDPARLHRPDRFQDTTKTHLVNILKGGIVYSNKVVIVSPIHSKHRLIHSSIHGLEPTLAIHKNKLIITPCGFDNSIWDPSKDRFLPVNYSAEDITGKAVCKVALQKQMGLPENSSSSLVGCIFSELADIDIDNVKAVVCSATRKDVQFIFMRSKMDGLDRTLASLQKELEGETVKFINKFDESLSHLIFAGSDIVLCQSYHDPLHQLPLKALRYGAAPLTLTPKENFPRHFIDQEPDTTKYGEFISSYLGSMSLSEALDKIKRNPSNWKQRMVGCMRKDFSWDAECYDIHVSAYTDIKKL